MPLCLHGDVILNYVVSYTFNVKIFAALCEVTLLVLNKWPTHVDEVDQ